MMRYRHDFDSPHGDVVHLVMDSYMLECRSHNAIIPTAAYYGKFLFTVYFELSQTLSTTVVFLDLSM